MHLRIYGRKDSDSLIVAAARAFDLVWHKGEQAGPEQVTPPLRRFLCLPGLRVEEGEGLLVIRSVWWQGRLAELLLGFNLGVEVGQLSVVILLLGLVAVLHRLRLAWPRPIVIDTVASGLVGIGLYWFLGRSFETSAAGCYKKHPTAHIHPIESSDFQQTLKRLCRIHP